MDDTLGLIRIVNRCVEFDFYFVPAPSSLPSPITQEAQYSISKIDIYIESLAFCAVEKDID
jgi:hypothetical protein